MQRASGLLSDTRCNQSDDFIDFIHDVTVLDCLSLSRVRKYANEPRGEEGCGR